MSRDSISATISVSPRATIFKFLIQCSFLFLICAASFVAIILDYGNANIWLLMIVLSIAHVLNMPIVDIIALFNEGYKNTTPPPVSTATVTAATSTLNLSPSVNIV